MTPLHRDDGFDQVMVKHPQGFEIILVRVAGTVHGWRNACPHVGVGLDWGDGRCLSGDNELQCAMHGALFLADSGACFAGPCAGKALVRVPLHVVDGMIVAD